MVASKREAIAAIMGLNPTAKPDFLAEFSKDDLEQYLARLGRVIECDDGVTHCASAFPATTTDPNATDVSWW